MRCEMNTIATPSPRSLRMMSISVAVSVSVSDEVGSSMMIIFALKESAFATSTICFCAVESLPARVLVSMFKPTRSSSARASACCAL